MERSIIVASSGSSGTEATVDVTFEPTHLGDSQTVLAISSNTGGEYSFPLHGHCLPPKPQGPIIIRPGHSINIPFKNIFPQSTQFKFSVNNLAFTVRGNETIKSGKIYNISVAYDGKQADPGVIKVGKLTVTNVLYKGKSAGAGKGQGEIEWVYYLRGALLTEGNRH